MGRPCRTTISFHGSQARIAKTKYLAIQRRPIDPNEFNSAASGEFGVESPETSFEGPAPRWIAAARDPRLALARCAAVSQIQTPTAYSEFQAEGQLLRYLASNHNGLQKTHVLLRWDGLGSVDNKIHYFSIPPAGGHRPRMPLANRVLQSSSD